MVVVVVEVEVEVVVVVVIAAVAAVTGGLGRGEHPVVISRLYYTML